MPLQDLTPQLRTRLNRMERGVGWFVVLATALLVFGFGYYVYQTARSKGWFKTKATYFTFVHSAEGIKVGDPVHLLGFDVGRITRIDAQPPRSYYDVFVEFEVLEPYYGYLWSEGSRTKITSADLLGKRVLEVTKGTNGHPTYISHAMLEIALADAAQYSDTNRWRLAEDVFQPGTTQCVARTFQPLASTAEAIASLGKTQVLVMDLQTQKKSLTAQWNPKASRFEIYAGATATNGYWLPSDESPALTARLDAMADQVQAALPNILNLTNQLTVVLSNSAQLTSNLNYVALDARPAVSNLAILVAQLNQRGALGEWLLPTNINDRLNATLTSADTNLVLLAQQLSDSLNNLADITSNLNRQVQANSNMLGRISKTVTDADDFVQGLKHHWLLRSAFKHKPAKAPAVPPPALQSPKQNATHER